MSREALVNQLLDVRFPRVSGDEPGAGKLQTQDWKFSPRERG